MIRTLLKGLAQASNTKKDRSFPPCRRCDPLLSWNGRATVRLSPIDTTFELVFGGIVDDDLCDALIPTFNDFVSFRPKGGNGIR